MEDRIPVQKGGHYLIEIEDLGMNGEGIGRISNFTVFVEGALPGEQAHIKVTKVKKRYAVGEQLNINRSSQDRVEPQCPYYNRCGGCQLQHLRYEAQLRYKEKLVRDNLERIGRLQDVHVRPIIVMDNPWEYRNKAQFPVGLQRDSIALGFYARKSHDVVDIEGCRIQRSFNGKVISVMKDYLKRFRVPVYEKKNHKGLIRHVLTKIGFVSGEVLVVVVANGRELPHSDILSDMMRERIPELRSFVLNVNTGKSSVILGNENIVLWGKEYIRDCIGPLEFQISPLSFFQVNPIQTEKLYGKALEYAGLTGRELVLDAYCGIGTISLFFARKAAKVIGIELVEQAIRDAERNAELNHFRNVDFIAGAVEQVVPQLLEQGIQLDVVVWILLERAVMKPYWMRSLRAVLPGLYMCPAIPPPLREIWHFSIGMDIQQKKYSRLTCFHIQML
jgi:23S rRNA (uracil1939-C5)-methyltransferase